MGCSHPFLNQLFNVLGFPKHGIKLDAEIKVPQLVIRQVAHNQKDTEVTKMIMLKNGNQVAHNQKDKEVTKMIMLKMGIKALYKQKFCEIIL